MEKQMTTGEAGKPETARVRQAAAGARANRTVETIDLKELFFLLLGHWKMILLSTLACATLFGGYFTFFLEPSFQARASIYITNTDSVINFSDLQLSAALTEDYTKIIKSYQVLKRVINEMGLSLSYKELSSLVTVTNPDKTHIVEITVICDDPELCREIANTLVNISVDQIYQIIGSSMPSVIDFSEAETVERVSPGLYSYLARGGLLGAFLCCGLLTVWMMMDTTLKTEEQVENSLNLPVLSNVPYFDGM